MSDICLDFEDLLVEIKIEYIDKRNHRSDKMWYAANAAYTKLTKYYCKINSNSYAIATVLDPRYKLDVYDTTQDGPALKESAEIAVNLAFNEYFQNFGPLPNPVVQPPPVSKKQKRFAGCTQFSELTSYLKEDRAAEETNPLVYWRDNKLRFPILAKMARDYLALQPTSKDVEGNFSKGRRTVPYFRRSQNASTVRNQMLVNSGYNLGIFT